MMRSLIITGLCLVSNVVGACGLDGSKIVNLEAGVALYYRFEPPQLTVSEHFSMYFNVCREGESLALDRFKIDAVMPTHGHGMNYLVGVVTRPDGVIETTGMMFHMPGFWQIRIDLSYNGDDRQVRIDYQL